MARNLRPLIFKHKYWKRINKSILDIFNKYIYKKLTDNLEISIDIKNQSSALIDAINNGEIYYSNGNLLGKFNSKIVKEIKKLGGKYNKIKRSYSFPKSKLTPDILSALTIRDSRDQKLNEDAISILDGIDINDIDSESLKTDINSILDELNKDLDKSLKGISVPFELTDNQKDIISEEWSENFDLYIKDFADKEVLELRTQIISNTKEGLRAENLNKIISKRFGVSERKAKFLARQETSLLVSKYRKSKYTELGLTKYKWSTSRDERVRPFHERLNNETFSWDSPPIVDKNGNKKHPGEDFNCRCLAIPIIE